MWVRPTWTVLLAFVLAWSSATAQESPDSAQIRETIENYITGWRAGDLELLSRVFATEEGVVLWTSGAPGEEVLSRMTFSEILARGSRPKPQYGTEWEILSLDVVDGKLAVAKVEISRSGGSYIDYLVLQNLADGWRIVTKTFVVR